MDKSIAIGIVIIITILLGAFLYISLRNKSVLQMGVLGIEITLLGGIFLIKSQASDAGTIISYALLMIGIGLSIVAIIKKDEK